MYIKLILILGGSDDFLFIYIHTYIYTLCLLMI